VIRGEEMYIEPNRPKADRDIDTFLPYELSLMKFHLLPLIYDMEEMKEPRRLLERVPDIDEYAVAPTSLVREFIGGSEYKY
jgi:uridine kinase